MPNACAILAPRASLRFSRACSDDAFRGEAEQRRDRHGLLIDYAASGDEAIVSAAAHRAFTRFKLSHHP